MRKIYLTALCVLFVLSAFAQNLKKLDEKNGFRDAVFETDFAQFKNMVLKEDAGDTKYYSRTSDEMKIGGAELAELYYAFYKGKLATVVIKTQGTVNSVALLETLQGQYGAGYQSNRYLPDYNWFGKKVSMSYKRNSATGDATVYLRSEPMAEARKADQAAAAKKGANDL